MASLRHDCVQTRIFNELCALSQQGSIEHDCTLCDENKPHPRAADFHCLTHREASFIVRHEGSKGVWYECLPLVEFRAEETQLSSCESYPSCDTQYVDRK